MSYQAVQDLVAEAIERHPERVAIETPQGRMTYAELDRRAADVAVALRDAGATAGTLLPVLAEDRRDLVAAMLGILRVGAVMVPLDPRTPATRIGHVLADTSARWVLAGDGTEVDDALAGAPGVTRIDLAGTIGAAAGADVPAYGTAPDDPCYVFYTSGSTGRPKGIVGRSDAVAHYIRWEIGLLGVDPQWRVGHLISPSFDAVLRDVFVPLAAGATVCVPPAGASLDPAALGRWIDAEGIDLVHCVPSLFRRLFDTGGEFRRLRCVAVSGERLAPADAGRWFARFGDRVRLLNLYGPSETTMTKTFHFVVPADADRPSVPVGRPMPDTEVLLLDGRGKPVEQGAVGELFLRTPYRSLGYLHRPEETRRAFVPNPRTGDPADIVYRTGDFGRLLPDGTLEFLGRRDHQVKIGGVRVELSGVEAVLREHPAVLEAAVVVDENAGEAPRLRAFVETAYEADPAEIRAHLREQLPDAAVPSTVTPLAALPRTISGKVDRRALSAPVRPAPVVPDDHVPPRTATERTAAGVWQTVLSTPVADVRQNFFDAGGSSLLVISLLSGLQRQFGVSIPLREFLAGPTVENVARLVEAALLAADAPLEDLLAEPVAAQSRTTTPLAVRDGV